MTPILLIALVNPLTPFRPSPDELRALYRRADTLQEQVTNRAFHLEVRANWVGDGGLWYRRGLKDGVSEYVWVSTSTGKREPLFDHEAVAQQLGKTLNQAVNAQRLPITNVVVAPDRSTLTFEADQRRWIWDRAKATLSPAPAATPAARPSERPRNVSFDGQWEFRIREGWVEVSPRAKDEWLRLGEIGGFTQAEWSPDQNVLAAYRVIPGDRKETFVLQSNVPNTTRAMLRSQRYDQPGDRLDTAELFLMDPQAKTANKVEIGPLNCGGWPWSSPPNLEWWKPTGQAKASLTLLEEVRGYQQVRLLEINPETGKFTTPIDERSLTFIDVTKTMLRRLESARSFVWRSERTGWSHLYRVDADTGVASPITRGEWVVRSLEHLDEAAGTLTFTANGREPGNPYLRHHYRVNLDGTGLVHLTPGNGDHQLQWSPGRRFYVDSYSRVEAPPVHELRRADGSLPTTLERADVTEVRLPMPEPFVAKGRDGKTDIYGIVFRPTHFDPTKRYPVIEDIYAGPHDSHVPLTYRPLFWHQRLAELGFIVVQIDGMGTSNRGKTFHDVAWKNIADAGFRDRIAWMRKLGEKIPQMDLNRVGIYGTSAGGQNSTGAVLFHPEFYKVAVSSCGCHDNRIDKIWWNELWMGYPVGPHYDEQSNITNAAKLRGKLLLMVGEVDQNVPPESTYRLADALIKAGKEFELVALPGQGHTGGGTFGERKRRDFFVRHLLGLEPPDWNTPG